MKKILLLAICITGLSANAQIRTPQPSPASTVKQKVGLTDIEIEYSRPSKRGRVIFGDLVPYGELWRTGANKNTTITTSDILIFGGDTLQAGTYALFTTPIENDSWDILIYKGTDNWGTPDRVEKDLIALQLKGKVRKVENITESLTIGVNNLTSDGASIEIMWDQLIVSIPFTVGTKTQVMDNIKKVMAGPSADDYYKAADYYYAEKNDLPQALEWINKSFELRGEEPFWMLRKKALIQAELGMYEEAIQTAKKSIEGAKAAEYDNYVKMNEESIKEWTPKVKVRQKKSR